MMRPISIKAVLISNMVQLGVALAICIVASLVALGVACSLAGFPDDIKPITDQLKSSSLFVSLVTSISVLPSSLIAGYVAGRIAGRGPVLHGALSACAWFILLILVILAGAPSDKPPHVGPGAAPLMSALLGTILFFGVPLLGGLGGYIAQQMGYRRTREVIAPATPVGHLVRYY